MKRKILFTFFGFLFLTVVFGGNVNVVKPEKKQEEIYKNLELFIDTLKIIQDNYVEPVDNKKLIYGALKGMLMSLDPYSAFLEPDMKKELEIETRGEFEGVGMEITLKDGIITVVTPIEDSPAWRAGIKEGDKIIEIDGKSTKGMTTFEAAQKLRGKKGTKVSISILREGTPNLLKFTLERDVIKIKSVKPKIYNSIGYIRLSGFQENTAEDLKKALVDFKNKGIKGLILDVRNNPGGLLSEVIEVCELFLPPNKLIVYTQGRKKEDTIRFYSKKTPVWKGPIVLLVNGGSASASEILFGALKDNYSNFLSIGTKTFGKGSVQNLIKLPDDSAIKLTIARYYTPKGICIEGEGITPDIEVKMEEEKPIIPTSEEDIQFKKAMEEIKKMI
ncbi:MAG: S41 family peptidase [candidate division WOR-3 bacterium]|nr:S41 family peptidase [Candidatus Omnitrophota bacterium]MCM8807161.1 S41 family peptidase [Candidatus Omnitrophota bacterium]